MPVVELVVDAEEVELAVDALWRGRPSAVAEEAQDDGRIRLVADVADLDAVPAGWPIAIVAVDPDAEDAWRAFAGPVRAGERVVLHPAWLPEPAPAAGDIVLVLDPGRVFGSGSHASTRQVVALLEGLDLDGAVVLDVGSGSGVLAIAALRLGAASAVAIDVDPSAAPVAMANAERNRVGDRLAASARPLQEVEGQYDVVLANIGRSVLVDLAPALLARVAPGGVLLLAGLLRGQVDDVRAAYGSAVVEGAIEEDGWVALRLRA